jgi:hypothetical protein
MRFGSFRFRQMARRFPAVLAFMTAVLMGILASAGGAKAQNAQCVALQNQIAALSGRTSPQTASYQRAAAKQQAELAKTVGYANSIGCNRQRFLFFGEAPPPQCGPLNQRIAAMRANLGQLQAVAQNGAVEQRRRALQAQYDAYCRQQVASRGNFFEQLFGGPRMQDIPIGRPDMPPNEELEERGPRRGSMAVCVRKCDGGFFPVSYSASSRNLDELNDLCTALCPNVEAILFTKRPDAEIEEAVSYEGQSYESLANASKFKKRFDSSCTCKPPNRSWAEVLANAEKLIANKNRRDIIVTPQQAEEMSRPRLGQVATRAARAPVAARTVAEAEEQKTVEALEREGKIEAEAAQRSNAGITPGRATAGPRFGTADGRREEITGPDGEKRSIRVIVPRS